MTGYLSILLVDIESGLLFDIRYLIHYILIQKMYL